MGLVIGWRGGMGELGSDRRWERRGVQWAFYETVGVRSRDSDGEERDGCGMIREMLFSSDGQSLVGYLEKVEH